MLLDMLHALGTRETYERFAPIIKPGTLTKDGEVLVKAIGKYYQKYKRDTVDWVEFGVYFQFEYRKLYNAEQMQPFLTIIDKLKMFVPDATVISNVFHTVIQEDYAAQIHNIALKIVGGDDHATLSDVQDKLTLYATDVDRYIHEVPDYVDLGDVKALVDATMGSGGFDWRLECLNVMVGPLRKGHFIIVGARPDSGKTTFLVSEVVNWAAQLPDDNHCILWINNEEMGEKVGRRMIESAIMWDSKKVEADPTGAAKAFRDKVGHPKRIRQVKRETFSTRDVDRLIKQYKPSLVIFDQLWKVTGFEKESANETGRQSLLFAWARGVASRCGPVVTVHQLGGEADGERFPMIKHLYGSQTGIQGEADAMIFLGRSRDPKEQDYRFISVPKNKMGDGPRCDRAKRNARYLLKVDYDHACFEEVEEYATV